MAKNFDQLCQAFGGDSKGARAEHVECCVLILILSCLYSFSQILESCKLWLILSIGRARTDCTEADAAIHPADEGLWLSVVFFSSPEWVVAPKIFG